MATKNVIADLNEAHAEYKCHHESFELRRRTLSNNATQFINQCLRCGAPISSAIAKKTIALERDPETVPLFDKELPVRWHEAYKERKEKFLVFTTRRMCLARTCSGLGIQNI